MSKKMDNTSGLAGGRILELKVTSPLLPEEPSVVLNDIIAALRKSFPTEVFTVEFTARGPSGKRYVNLTIPKTKEVKSE